jgi:hypothetical protein
VIMLGAGMLPQGQPPVPGMIAAPTKGPTAEYGEYIVGYAGCRDCHGADLKGKEPGGFEPAGPSLRVVKGWTAAQFLTTLRTGVDPSGHALSGPMPWKVLRRMDDNDLTAIYQYLEPVCKIRKEEDGGNCNHGGKASSPFVIARGNTAELLETVDQAFHNIALAVDLFVERSFAVFVAAMRNGVANMFLVQVGSKRLAGVALVCHQPFGAQARTTPQPGDGSAVHKLLRLRNVALLPGSEHKGD